MKRKKRIRREIKTLDLHNHTHSEAPRLIFNFIMENADEMPVQIITGKSELMREIATRIILQNDFWYHYHMQTNYGCLIVTEYKWKDL